MPQQTDPLFAVVAAHEQLIHLWNGGDTGIVGIVAQYLAAVCNLPYILFGHVQLPEVDPKADPLKEAVNGIAASLRGHSIALPLQGGLEDPAYRGELVFSGGIGIPGKSGIEDCQRLAVGDMGTVAADLHAQAVGQSDTGG